jgi:hypothetical protein
MLSMTMRTQTDILFSIQSSKTKPSLNKEEKEKRQLEKQARQLETEQKKQQAKQEEERKKEEKKMKEKEAQQKREDTKKYRTQQTKQSVHEYFMEASSQDGLEIVSKYVKEQELEYYRKRTQAREQEMEAWKKIMEEKNAQEEFPVLSK